MPEHRFGGEWTTEKLERLRKYLAAYMQIMKDKDFRVAYIDAFAGTGYRQSPSQDDASLFDAFSENESQHFIKGSATIALEIEPRFDRYIFIERKASYTQELEKLKQDYPDRASDIIIIQADANSAIQELCEKNWRCHRAVLFLDPYGMQVSWETIKSIAATNAIDLWILFPAAIGVNRLLRRDGQIEESWRNRLDSVFGAKDWYDRFYQTMDERDLFGSHQALQKVANIKTISQYYVQRLQSIFAGVAENPLTLSTPEGRPLYLLCFAASNKKGAKTAIRIAQDILRR